MNNPKHAEDHTKMQTSTRSCAWRDTSSAEGPEEVSLSSLLTLLLTLESLVSDLGDSVLTTVLADGGGTGTGGSTTGSGDDMVVAGSEV